MRYRLLLSLVVMSVVVLWACDTSRSGPPDQGRIQVGSRSLSAEFLLTNDERMKGVSLMPHLKDGEGVLFVYPEPVPDLHWANRTVLGQALSLAFVAPDGRIRRMERMGPDQNNTVTAGAPVQFLLVVPDGWFQDQQIARGDRVQVPGDVITGAEPVFTHPDRRWISVGKTDVLVELARTASQRRRGLMHRKALPENQGMLFVYRDAGIRSFHMKNTLIPLDIAFIDASGNIREIRSMDPLNTSSVTSARPAQYVLEMRQGWFRDHGVTEGDHIDLSALKGDTSASGGN